MSAPPAVRPRAVVLHDDRALAFHIHGLLGDLGVDVHHVGGPLELLRPVQAAGASIALFVLGAASLERRDRDLVPLLRETAPQAAILVVYPPSLRERAADMLAAGADAALPEPFYPGEFVAYARRALLRPSDAASGRSEVAETTAAPATPERTPQFTGATPVQQIAVGVAHAVRNPLQIMELLIASAEEGEELDLEELRGLMGRIAGVAADLSRFGDVSRSRPARVHLEPLVHEVFSAAPGSLVVHPFATDLHVLAEPQLLRSALDVLRDRALRESGPSGPVDVRVSAVGSAVDISVSDSGAPPDDDALTHFFEPDWDMDVVQAGTWLEMAAFAGMVHSQGGTVSVAPGDENGVTVTIRLAIADGDDREG